MVLSGNCVASDLRNAGQASVLINGTLSMGLSGPSVTEESELLLLCVVM